jgi:hypothetical protein
MGTDGSVAFNGDGLLASGPRLLVLHALLLTINAYRLSPGAAQAMREQSVECAAGIDDDGLAGHRLSAAHRHHHVRAIVLVGRLSQQRTGSVA